MALKRSGLAVDMALLFISTLYSSESSSNVIGSAAGLIVSLSEGYLNWFLPLL